MADRTSSLTIAIRDQFSAPQKEFVDGMKKAENATNELSKTIQTHGSQQTTLHGILGISRREANLLEGSFVQLTGATGPLGNAIGALSSGIGPVGIAFVAVSTAVVFLAQQLQEGEKRTREFAKEQVNLGQTVEQVTKALNEQNPVTAQTSDRLGTAGLAAERAAAANAKLAEELVKVNIVTKEGLGYAAMKADFAKFEAGANDRAIAQMREQEKALEALRLANVPVRAEEETRERFDAAQFAARMNRQAQLSETIIADTRKIDDLNRQAALNVSNAYAQAANDARRSLDSMIESELQLSKVTAQDIADTAAGRYVNKPDENIRRVRIFQTIDADIDRDPEAQRILNLLPQQVREKLQAAFREGGTKKLHLTATDLVGGMEAFTDLGGWDVNKLADQVQAKIEQLKGKKQLTMAVQQVLIGRGFDPSSQEFQQSLGIETGSERALKMNATVNFDKAKLATEVDKAKKELDGLFASYNPTNALQDSASKNSAGITTAGNKAANSWLDGFDTGLTDGAGGVYGHFLSNLTGTLDDRYVRKPKAYIGPDVGVTP